MNPLDFGVRPVEGLAPQAAGAGQSGISVAGIPGGGIPRELQQDDQLPVDKTFNLLVEMGGQLLEEPMRAEQQRRFLDGMQRAAAGDALSEIDPDNPLAKIFGPGSTKRGAAAYNAVVRTGEKVNELYGRMRELRTKDGTEIQEEVGRIFADNLTGDVDTDIVIESRFTEQLPQFFAEHAKEHYKWVQEEHYNAAIGVQRTNARRLSYAAEARDRGTVTDEDFAAIQQRVRDEFRRPAGMDNETHKKLRIDSFITAMQDNDHHYVATAMSSGLFDDLSPDERKGIIDAREKYETRLRDEFGAHRFGVALGELKARAAKGRIQPAEIVRVADDINAEWFRLTGIDTAYIKPSQLSAMIESRYEYQFSSEDSERERRARAYDDNLKDELKRREVQLAVNSGAAYTAVRAGHTRDQVEQVQLGTFDRLVSSGGAARAGQLLTQEYVDGGFVNSALQNRWKAGIRAAQGVGYPGKSFDEVVGVWQTLRAHPEFGDRIASAYFGDDHFKLLAYSEGIDAQLPPNDAFRAAFGNPARPEGNIPKELRQEAQTALREVRNSGGLASIGRAFTGRSAAADGDWELTPGAVSLLQATVLPAAVQKAHTLGIPVKEAIEHQLATAKDVDVIGPFATPLVSGQRKLFDAIGVPQKQAGSVMVRAILDVVTTSGSQFSDADMPEEWLAAARAPTDAKARAAVSATPLGTVRDVASGAARVVRGAERVLKDPVTWRVDRIPGDKLRYSVTAITKGRGVRSYILREEDLMEAKSKILK